MKPVDQQVMHDPDKGHYGDCQRACIASLLELDPSEVPHFYQGGGNAEFFRRLNRFMAQKGLFHLESQAFSFGAGVYSESAPCYHLIYGNTERGTRHAVVGLNGNMVHDPHPSRAGLLDDGEQTFGFLVATNQ